MLLGPTAGIMIGLLVEPILSVFLQPCLPIAVMATLDAVLEGIRIWLGDIFSDWVFVVPLLSNAFTVELIVFTDSQIGTESQLSTGVVVVFEIRIFNNATATRRTILHTWADLKTRRRSDRTDKLR